MLNNPTSPIVAPSAERSAGARAQGQHQEIVSLHALHINWRWVGILTITLACLINGIVVSRWLYAQDVTLAASALVGSLVFLVPRLTIWISAKL